MKLYDTERAYVDHAKEQALEGSALPVFDNHAKQAAMEILEERRSTQLKHYIGSLPLESIVKISQMDV